MTTENPNGEAGHGRRIGDPDQLDARHREGYILFDDVLLPWNRVFLTGRGITEGHGDAGRPGSRRPGPAHD
jgi:hypothetical protein